MEKPRIPQDKLIQHSKFKKFTEWVHKHHLALALVVGAAVVAIIFIIATAHHSSDLLCLMFFSSFGTSSS